MCMRNSYVLKLSLRNIMARKLRSFLTVSGVAIGVGFIIFLISLGYGLREISTKEVANLEALEIVDVSPGKSKIIKIDDKKVQEFKNLGNVVDAEPQANLVGKISAGTSVIEGVVYGKNTEYLKLEESQLATGRLYESNFSHELLVNESAIKQLGILEPSKALGKTLNIEVIVGTEFLKEGNAEPKKAEYKCTIVGVLKNQSSPYVYIPLEMLKGDGLAYYSSAKVRVASRGVVDVARKELEGQGYKVTSLKDTVDQINQFFTIFQLILLSFGFIAIIVAAIGMFNTLTISLLEKTREVSFMKVLGTVNKDIWRLFLGEAIILGFMGAFIGISGGMLIGNSINAFLLKLAEETGNKPVEIFYTPVIFIVLTFVIALLVSILTGIYPSFRATRIDPLEALRYE